MSADTIIAILLVLGLSVEYYRFAERGRAYGYQALATRTSQLLNQDVSQVWLLRSGTEVEGWKVVRLIFAQNNSIWSYLNTGFLAYISDGKLIIEYPWWNKMRPLLNEPITQLTPKLTKIIYGRQAYPAVRVGHQSYAVMARNSQNTANIIRQLDFENYVHDETLLKSFMDDLSRS